MEFLNLVNTPREELYNVFIKTFQDYKVNVKISFNQFLTMQKRSCYSPKFSFGCFDKGKLVGFQMNGVRTINSELMCYGIAIGYIPEYRNIYNLSNDYFGFHFSSLGNMGIKKYSCEILRDNLPSKKIIEKFGGIIDKKIITYRKRINELEIDQTINDDIEFNKECDLSFLPDIEQLYTESSWQNSFDAINAIIEDFFITTIRKDGSIIGYGVINKQQGDIPQFIIHNKFRHKGLSDLLLAKLINNTCSLYAGFLNINEENVWLNEFLLRKRFNIYTKSYEYIKKY